MIKNLFYAALSRICPGSAFFRAKAEKYRQLMVSAKKLRGIIKHGGPQRTYAEWISLYDTMDDERRFQIIETVSRMNEIPPLFDVSVVMAMCGDISPDAAKKSLDSLRGQLYPFRDLCIACGTPVSAQMRDFLTRYAVDDERIKLCFQKGSSDASAVYNDALASADGEFVAFVEYGGVLAENALFEAAHEIKSNPDAVLIYSDEDTLDDDGTRRDPYFKPDWNPDLFLAQNYFSCCIIVKHELVKRVGGFKAGCGDSRYYDLLLRCVEAAEDSAVRHIPKILCHRGKSLQNSADTAKKAVEDSLTRRGVDADVNEIAPGTGFLRIVYKLSSFPSVSIIIPTFNGVGLLEKCINSIKEKTTYGNYEIIIIDNGSTDAKTLAYLERSRKEPGVTVLRDDGEFNYSRLNNAAVKISGGEIICLLNNDTEGITPEWLTEMAGNAVRPGIGAVGARLWYPNETLQHGGILLGYGGAAGHFHQGIARNDPGYFGRALTAQNVSAVTAACLAIRRSVFDEVGGFDETLAVTYNDVDFCVRVIDAGYRNLWTPFAELYHYESATRGDDGMERAKRKRRRKEREYLQKRHERKLFNDPMYNPNLSLTDGYFELAFPPRSGRAC